jgi:hypothetical protein
MSKRLVLPMAFFTYPAATVSATPPRDRDHDRLPDRWERKYHLSTSKPSARRDLDRDRLRNRREFRLRTHPRRSDTDRDHLRDGAEVRRFRTNPRRRDTRRRRVQGSVRAAQGNEPAQAPEPPEASV